MDYMCQMEEIRFKEVYRDIWHFRRERAPKSVITKKIGVDLDKVEQIVKKIREDEYGELELQVTPEIVAISIPIKEDTPDLREVYLVDARSKFAYCVDGSLFDLRVLREEEQNRRGFIDASCAL